MSMHRVAVAVAAILVGACAVVNAQGLKDVKGVSDPALFSRMPSFYLSYADSYREEQFGSHLFTVRNGKALEKVRVEGRVREWRYAFDAKSGAVKPSALQIQRNYQGAAQKLGGKVLWEEASGYCRTTLQVARDGKEIWVELYPRADGNGYRLTIVERQEMKQDVVASAEALQAGLGTAGHVEVPGIFFDTNESVLKPESEAAVAEVAKLLKASPGLRVWVVGHTDATGQAPANLSLSSARAASVVQALVQKHGIEARRLGAFGAGPYAPVATNADEAGRARNRRVELVAQVSASR